MLSRSSCAVTIVALVIYFILKQILEYAGPFCFYGVGKSEDQSN